MVNDLAGTTRDPVDETIDIDGEDWLFIDTAGIKRRLHKVSGADYYSSLRTQAAIERSELALVLFDSSQPISDQDLKVMSQAVDAGRAVVLVFNKWDLMDDFGRQRLERPPHILKRHDTFAGTLVFQRPGNQFVQNRHNAPL